MTVMEVSVTPGGVTVIVAVPETVPSVAVIVEEPTATPVARPEEAMVATEVVPEVHVTDVVRVCVEPSE